MKKGLIGAAVVLMFTAITAAQSNNTSRPETCSLAALTSAATPVDAARKALLALPIGDGLETDVPPDAQQAIISMKDALSGFIRAYMRCVPPQPDAADLQSKLSSLAHAFKLPRGQSFTNEQLPPEFGRYGFELSFEVRVTENPHLVSVKTEFSIECGGDTVLLIFAPNGESWKEVLHWQVEPYEQVSGGTMAFDYGISPEDDSGHWYMVIHTVTPWCSSTWSSIRYAVLRPTMNSVAPKILLAQSDSMWWGGEDYGKLVVAKNDFDLRFHSSSIDGGVHNRVFIRHYSVSEDVVKRIQPVAVSPRDFVDEWLVSTWAEASEWSLKSASSRLKQAHELLSGPENSKYGFSGYGSIYKCSDGGHYQVELQYDSEPQHDDEASEEQCATTVDSERSVYLHVAGPNPYTMIGVSDTPDRKCGGPDLLESMATK